MGQMNELQIEQDAAARKEAAPAPDRVAELEAENLSLKRQIVQTQRAFLMQQRELNVLQMQHLDQQEKALT